MNLNISHSFARFAAILFLCLSVWNSHAQVITTIAGPGSGSFGDGGPATAAMIAPSTGIAVENSGNIYLAGNGRHNIRKINLSGIITTIAGTPGSGGFGGDGGPATAALLRYAMGVAVDGIGNVFIADDSNNRIRMVDTFGMIHTVAGNGTAGFSGDGGPATAALLNHPCGVGVDNSGNIYIAEPANARIRKVNSSGIIYTIAGTGYSGYSGDGGPATAARIFGPVRVIADRNNNIYIDDLGNSRVRKISPSGMISTVAGCTSGGGTFSGDGGPATNAGFNNIQGIAIDTSGNLFIADQSNQRTRKVTSYGLVSTVAGTGIGGYGGDGGPAINAKLYYPIDVAADMQGNIFILDCSNGRIRKVNVCSTPTLGFIAGPNSLCAGDTTSLTDTTAGGVWSSGNPAIASVSSTGMVHAISAGITAITYAVPNSCDTNFLIHPITIQGTNAGTIIGADTICVGDTVHFSDSIAGGTWTTSNFSVVTISPSGIVSALGAGSASIAYTVAGICGSDTASFHVFVRSSASCYSESIQEKFKLANFEVFPNPGNGSFTISLKPNRGYIDREIQITITNTFGQNVKEFNSLPGKETNVQLNVPGGVYFIIATAQGGEKTIRKIIII